jgi:catechol 2,3-dioxygenase-like lactoylglutathione lyase family enzyme
MPFENISLYFNVLYIYGWALVSASYDLVMRIGRLLTGIKLNSIFFALIRSKAVANTNSSQIISLRSGIIIPQVFLPLGRSTCFLILIGSTLLTGIVNGEENASLSNTETTVVEKNIQPPLARVGMIGPTMRCTDFDRSIRFYTAGLGMTVLRKLQYDEYTEVVLSFDGTLAGPVLLLGKDNRIQENTSPIAFGDGFGRIVLRTTDVAKIAKQLSAAGYDAGDVHSNPDNNMRNLWVEDPDGYKFTISEISSTRK